MMVWKVELNWININNLFILFYLFIVIKQFTIIMVMVIVDSYDNNDNDGVDNDGVDNDNDDDMTWW